MNGAAAKAATRSHELPQTSTHLLAQTTLPAIAPEGGTFWLPPAASTAAANTDAVFYFIYWVSVFFFVLIVALMVYFVLRYRQRVPGTPAPGQATHSTALEITWTAIPLVLVGVMFYTGFRGYMDLVNPPKGAMDDHVLGQKWRGTSPTRTGTWTPSCTCRSTRRCG